MLGEFVEISSLPCHDVYEPHRDISKSVVCDSCHSRVIRNQQYLYPKFPPTAVAKLLQYSGSRVEHRDGLSSCK